MMIMFYFRTVIPFMTNYQFACRGCSPNSLENFTKKVSSKYCSTWIVYGKEILIYLGLFVFANCR